MECWWELLETTCL
ncbi:rCG20001, partial [Rattus norvegicus]